MYRAFLPGFGLLRGSEAYLSSNMAGQLLPPPSANVVQYGYFRAGYSPDAARVGGVRLVPLPDTRPLPAAARRAARAARHRRCGRHDPPGGRPLAPITAAACVAGWFFLRRESAARWLGAKAQRPLSWILVKRKREPIDDGPERASALRAQALVVLREGWKLGSAGVAANLFLTYVILLASLRFVGVSSVATVRAGRVRRLRGRVLGRRGHPDHRQRARRRRRRAHDDADRIEHSLGRRARRRRASLARLLLRPDPAARRHHPRPFPQRGCRDRVDADKACVSARRVRIAASLAHHAVVSAVTRGWETSFSTWSRTGSSRRHPEPGSRIVMPWISVVKFSRASSWLARATGASHVGL